MPKDLNKDEIQEKVKLLKEARELIEEAVDKISKAVIGTSEEHRADAYIIPALEMCCYEKTDWLGSQPSNIEELIKALQEEDEE